MRSRKTEVFRLKNSSATQVATTINTFLTSQRNLETGPNIDDQRLRADRARSGRGAGTGEQQPGVQRHAAILSTEIKTIIDQLDARPPMVMIQVLIAKVDLEQHERVRHRAGLAGLGALRSQPVEQPCDQPPDAANLDVLASSPRLEPDHRAATNTPGFNFNNTAAGQQRRAPMHAMAPTTSAARACRISAVGRTNSTLGYGGLVLSLASENVSVLLRALAENHRVEVLQRPQIMTMDNQPAYIQVGQRVPRITASNITAVGTTNRPRPRTWA